MKFRGAETETDVENMEKINGPFQASKHAGSRVDVCFGQIPVSPYFPSNHPVHMPAACRKERRAKNNACQGVLPMTAYFQEIHSSTV